MIAFNVHFLRIIQQVTWGLLLLIGGIHLNVFAVDTQKRGRSASYFIDTKSNPSPPPPSLETGSERVNGSYWKEAGGLHKELLDTIHDVVKGVLSSSERDGPMRLAAERLKEELEEKTLTNRWEIPQVIDFLRGKIAKKKSYPPRRVVEIRVMGEFLKLITLPNPEILHVVDLLGNHLSREESNSYIKVAAIQVTGEILSQYALSAYEVSRTLNQLVENVFDGDTFVGKVAEQVLTNLLSQNIVSDFEKRRIIFQITHRVAQSHYWGQKVTALKALHEFLKKGILSDPSDGRQIVPTVSTQLSDGNWSVQVEAIKVLRECLVQNIVSDPDERRKIALMISARLDDESWEVQLEALNSSQILLSQDILSDPEKLNVWYKVARLIFHRNWMIGEKVLSMLKGLWVSDFPHSGKVKILRAVERNYPTSYVGRRAIQALRAAAWAGLPPGLNIIHKKWIKSAEFWGTRRSAVRYLYAVLKTGVLLSFTDRGKILSLIGKLVTDEDSGVQRAAIDRLPEFLNREGLFDPSERKRILFMVMMKWIVSRDQQVQRAALGAIKRFIKQGILTEELAIEFVNTSTLSALDKIVIGLELDKQFSDINFLEERQAERKGTCQEALTAVRVVPRVEEG